MTTDLVVELSIPRGWMRTPVNPFRDLHGMSQLPGIEVRKGFVM